MSYSTLKSKIEQLIQKAQSGDGDITSKLDASVLKFNTYNVTSYSTLFNGNLLSYNDMALSFNVLIESIKDGEEFAGLGVWNGSEFAGYNFYNKVFVYGTRTYPYPSTTTAVARINLKIGEWNHFKFRRLNNQLLEIYVNGDCMCSVPGDYANTYFIFGFKNVIAYIDNYQYLHDGVGQGLITDFDFIDTTDGSSQWAMPDGGYWSITNQGFEGVISK